MFVQIIINHVDEQERMESGKREREGVDRVTS